MESGGERWLKLDGHFGGSVEPEGGGNVLKSIKVILLKIPRIEVCGITTGPLL